MPDPATVINLEPVGTTTFPRWIIASKDGRFWNGNVWASKRKEALLFAHLLEASRAVEEIQRHEYGNKPCLKRITVPLVIEVRSDEPVDPETLKAWIKKAATMYVDYQKNGNGPEGSLVLIGINWEEIK